MFSFNIAHVGNHLKTQNEMTLRGKMWEQIFCHLDKGEGRR